MNKDFIQSIIDQLAKKLVWDDLDEYDRKMYLTEAKKKFNKENSSLVKELSIEMPAKKKNKKNV